MLPIAPSTYDGHTNEAAEPCCTSLTEHEHEGWEGPEPHWHPHRHTQIRCKHSSVIDHHHERWPKVS